MNILCPKCRNILYKDEKTYKCAQGHSFDIAKEGYLNLNLKNSKNTGDNPEMIKARKNTMNSISNQHGYCILILMITL